MEEARLILLDENGRPRAAFPRWARLRPLLTIGRAADNDFVVEDPLVSAHHLTAVAYQGQWALFDRGSLNGTLVRGQPISGTAVLRAGDEVRIGRSRLLFEPSWPPVRAPVPATATSATADESRSGPASPRASAPRASPKSTDLLLAEWCTELSASVPIKRAALFLPEGTGRLVPCAGWQWQMAELTPMGHETLQALTHDAVATLLWNEPGSASRRYARVHVLCAVPLERDASPHPLWHYRTAPPRERDVAAVWLECRRVDPDQRRSIEHAAQLLPARIRGFRRAWA